MFPTHFAQHSLWMLLTSSVFLLVSIFLLVNHRQKPALITLFIAAFGLRIFMAGLDPFLHHWDERYHALVAKNLMQHPLKPTLFDRELLNYDYRQWVGNYIWLHKQPFALWQMALSFTLFGVSAFTARVPTIVLSALLILLIYSMAKKCFNRSIAYYSALLYCVSYYTLNFSSGGEAVDHVDFAFFFYITASFWAWLNYNETGKNKWWILIGVFAGLAVLTKWLTGLLVFAGWGVVILADAELRAKLHSYITLLKAFGISAAIFLPWQIYIFIRFPQEAAYEMGFNTKHLFEAIEDHEYGYWFYLDRLDENFGWLVPFIILPAYYLLWRKNRNRNAAVFMITVTVVCYLFFSFAATKMPAYCHIVLSVIFIALGVFTSYIFTHAAALIKNVVARKAILACLLCLLSYKVLDLKTIELSHTLKDKTNNNRENMVRCVAYYKNINDSLPDDIIIFRAPHDTEIEAMFFTGNIVYNTLPDERKFKYLKGQGEKMAVFLDPQTPDFLRNDTTVLKLQFK